MLGIPLVLLIHPPIAAGQTLDPAATAAIQAGPLGLSPRLTIRNVGFDENVFNSPDAPSRDLTACG